MEDLINVISLTSSEDESTSNVTKKNASFTDGFKIKFDIIFSNHEYMAEKFPHFLFAELLNDIKQFMHNPNYTNATKTSFWRNFLDKIYKPSLVSQHKVHKDIKYNRVLGAIMAEYLNFRCEILKMEIEKYPDNETSRELHGQVKDLSHKLGTSLLHVFNGNKDFVTFALLQVKPDKHYQTLLSKLFSNILSYYNKVAIEDHITYVRLILCFRRWKTLVSHATVKKAINDISRRVLPQNMSGRGDLETRDFLQILPKHRKDKENATNFLINHKLLEGGLLDKAINRYFDAHEEYARNKKIPRQRLRFVKLSTLTEKNINIFNNSTPNAVVHGSNATTIDLSSDDDVVCLSTTLSPSSNKKCNDSNLALSSLGSNISKDSSKIVTFSKCDNSKILDTIEPPSTSTNRNRSSSKILVGNTDSESEGDLYLKTNILRRKMKKRKNHGKLRQHVSQYDSSDSNTSIQPHDDSESCVRVKHKSQESRNSSQVSSMTNIDTIVSINPESTNDKCESTGHMKVSRESTQSPHISTSNLNENPMSPLSLPSSSGIVEISDKTGDSTKLNPLYSDISDTEIHLNDSMSHPQNKKINKEDSGGGGDCTNTDSEIVSVHCESTTVPSPDSGVSGSNGTNNSKENSDAEIILISQVSPPPSESDGDFISKFNNIDDKTSCVSSFTSASIPLSVKKIEITVPVYNIPITNQDKCYKTAYEVTEVVPELQYATFENVFVHEIELEELHNDKVVEPVRRNKDKSELETNCEIQSEVFAEIELSTAELIHGKTVEENLVEDETLVDEKENECESSTNIQSIIVDISPDQSKEKLICKDLVAENEIKNNDDNQAKLVIIEAASSTDTCESPLPSTKIVSEVLNRDTKIIKDVEVTLTQANKVSALQGITDHSSNKDVSKNISTSDIKEFKIQNIPNRFKKTKANCHKKRRGKTLSLISKLDNRKSQGHSKTFEKNRRNSEVIEPIITETKHCSLVEHDQNSDDSHLLERIDSCFGRNLVKNYQALVDEKKTVDHPECESSTDIHSTIVDVSPDQSKGKLICEELVAENEIKNIDGNQAKLVIIEAASSTNRCESPLLPTKIISQVPRDTKIIKELEVTLTQANKVSVLQHVTDPSNEDCQKITSTSDIKESKTKNNRFKKTKANRHKKRRGKTLQVISKLDESKSQGHGKTYEKNRRNSEVIEPTITETKHCGLVEHDQNLDDSHLLKRIDSCFGRNLIENYQALVDEKKTVDHPECESSTNIHSTIVDISPGQSKEKLICEVLVTENEIKNNDGNQAKLVIIEAVSSTNICESPLPSTKIISEVSNRETKVIKEVEVTLTQANKVSVLQDVTDHLSNEDLQKTISTSDIKESTTKNKPERFKKTKANRHKKRRGKTLQVISKLDERKTQGYDKTFEKNRRNSEVIEPIITETEHCSPVEHDQNSDDSHLLERIDSCLADEVPSFEGQEIVIETDKTHNVEFNNSQAIDDPVILPETVNSKIKENQRVKKKLNRKKVLKISKTLLSSIIPSDDKPLISSKVDESTSQNTDKKSQKNVKYSEISESIISETKHGNSVEHDQVSDDSHSLDPIDDSCLSEIVPSFEGQEIVIETDKSFDVEFNRSQAFETVILPEIVKSTMDDIPKCSKPLQCSIISYNNTVSSNLDESTIQSDGEKSEKIVEKSEISQSIITGSEHRFDVEHDQNPNDSHLNYQIDSSLSEEVPSFEGKEIVVETDKSNDVELNRSRAVESVFTSKVLNPNLLEQLSNFNYTYCLSDFSSVSRKHLTLVLDKKFENISDDELITKSPTSTTNSPRDNEILQIMSYQRALEIDTTKSGFMTYLCLTANSLPLNENKQSLVISPTPSNTKGRRTKPKCVRKLDTTKPLDALINLQLLATTAEVLSDKPEIRETPKLSKKTQSELKRSIKTKLNDSKRFRDRQNRVPIRNTRSTKLNDSKLISLPMNSKPKLKPKNDVAPPKTSNMHEGIWQQNRTNEILQTSLDLIKNDISKTMTTQPISTSTNVSSDSDSDRLVIAEYKRKCDKKLKSTPKNGELATDLNESDAASVTEANRRKKLTKIRDANKHPDSESDVEGPVIKSHHKTNKLKASCDDISSWVCEIDLLNKFEINFPPNDKFNLYQLPLVIEDIPISDTMNTAALLTLFKIRFIAIHRCMKSFDKKQFVSPHALQGIFDKIDMIQSKTYEQDDLPLFETYIKDLDQHLKKLKKIERGNEKLILLYDFLKAWDKRIKLRRKWLNTKWSDTDKVSQWHRLIKNGKEMKKNVLNLGVNVLKQKLDQTVSDFAQMEQCYRSPHKIFEDTLKNFVIPTTETIGTAYGDSIANSAVKNKISAKPKTRKFKSKFKNTKFKSPTSIVVLPENKNLQSEKIPDDKTKQRSGHLNLLKESNTKHANDTEANSLTEDQPINLFRSVISNEKSDKFLCDSINNQIEEEVQLEMRVHNNEPLNKTNGSDTKTVEELGESIERDNTNATINQVECNVTSVEEVIVNDETKQKNNSSVEETSELFDKFNGGAIHLSTDQAPEKMPLNDGVIDTKENEQETNEMVDQTCTPIVKPNADTNLPSINQIDDNGNSNDGFTVIDYSEHTTIESIDEIGETFAIADTVANSISTNQVEENLNTNNKRIFIDKNDQEEGVLDKKDKSFDNVGSNLSSTNQDEDNINSNIEVVLTDENKQNIIELVKEISQSLVKPNQIEDKVNSKDILIGTEEDGQTTNKLVNESNNITVDSQLNEYVNTNDKTETSKKLAKPIIDDLMNTINDSVGETSGSLYASVDDDSTKKDSLDADLVKKIDDSLNEVSKDVSQVLEVHHSVEKSADIIIEEIDECVPVTKEALKTDIYSVHQNVEIDHIKLDDSVETMNQEADEHGPVENTEEMIIENEVLVDEVKECNGNITNNEQDVNQITKSTKEIEHNTLVRHDEIVDTTIKSVKVIIESIKCDSVPKIKTIDDSKEIIECHQTVVAIDKINSVDKIMSDDKKMSDGLVINDLEDKVVKNIEIKDQIDNQSVQQTIEPQSVKQIEETAESCLESTPKIQITNDNKENFNSQERDVTLIIKPDKIIEIDKQIGSECETELKEQDPVEKNERKPIQNDTNSSCIENDDSKMDYPLKNENKLSETNNTNSSFIVESGLKAKSLLEINDSSTNEEIVMEKSTVTNNDLKSDGKILKNITDGVIEVAQPIEMIDETNKIKETGSIISTLKEANDLEESEIIQEKDEVNKKNQRNKTEIVSIQHLENESSVDCVEEYKKIEMQTEISKSIRQSKSTEEEAELIQREDQRIKVVQEIQSEIVKIISNTTEEHRLRIEHENETLKRRASISPEPDYKVKVSKIENSITSKVPDFTTEFLANENAYSDNSCHSNKSGIDFPEYLVSNSEPSTSQTSFSIPLITSSAPVTDAIASTSIEDKLDIVDSLISKNLSCNNEINDDLDVDVLRDFFYPYDEFENHNVLNRSNTPINWETEFPNTLNLSLDDSIYNESSNDKISNSKKDKDCMISGNDAVKDDMTPWENILYPLSYSLEPTQETYVNMESILVNKNKMSLNMTSTESEVANVQINSTEPSSYMMVDIFANKSFEEVIYNEDQSNSTLVDQTIKELSKELPNDVPKLPTTIIEETVVTTTPSQNEYDLVVYDPQGDTESNVESPNPSYPKKFQQTELFTINHDDIKENDSKSENYELINVFLNRRKISKDSEETIEILSDSADSSRSSDLSMSKELTSPTRENDEISDNEEHGPLPRLLHQNPSQLEHKSFSLPDSSSEESNSSVAEEVSLCEEKSSSEKEMMSVTDEKLTEEHETQLKKDDKLDENVIILKPNSSPVSKPKSPEKPKLENIEIPFQRKSTPLPLSKHTPPSKLKQTPMYTDITPPLTPIKQDLIPSPEKLNIIPNTIENNESSSNKNGPLDMPTLDYEDDSNFLTQFIIKKPKPIHTQTQSPPTYPPLPPPLVLIQPPPPPDTSHSVLLDPSNQNNETVLPAIEIRAEANTFLNSAVTRELKRPTSDDAIHSASKKPKVDKFDLVKSMPIDKISLPHSSSSSRGTKFYSELCHSSSLSERQLPINPSKLDSSTLNSVCNSRSMSPIAGGNSYSNNLSRRHNLSNISESKERGYRSSNEIRGNSYSFSKPNASIKPISTKYIPISTPIERSSPPPLRSVLLKSRLPETAPQSIATPKIKVIPVDLREKIYSASSSISKWSSTSLPPASESKMSKTSRSGLNQQSRVSLLQPRIKPKYTVDMSKLSKIQSNNKTKFVDHWVPKEYSDEEVLEELMKRAASKLKNDTNRFCH